jgi:Flp pilus assembly pilin Flp
MLKYWKTFVRCSKAATAIEYAFIAAGISVAIAAIVFVLGDSLEGTFTDVNSKLDQ